MLVTEPQVVGPEWINQDRFNVGRPVIDRTGLTERYHYFLSFAPLASPAGADTPEFGPPDIFAALPRQLGLNLEPVKAGVSVVVVDGIERRPTEN